MDLDKINHEESGYNFVNLCAPAYSRPNVRFCIPECEFLEGYSLMGYDAALLVACCFHLQSSHELN
jgi:hypothetical protein